MPGTRPGLGISTLPNGTENYAACLYFHTSTRMSPEEIHKIGLEEAERISKLIRQLTKQRSSTVAYYLSLTYKYELVYVYFN